MSIRRELSFEWSWPFGFRRIRFLDVVLCRSATFGSEREKMDKRRHRVTQNKRIVKIEVEFALWLPSRYLLACAHPPDGCAQASYLSGLEWQ